VGASTGLYVEASLCHAHIPLSGPALAALRASDVDMAWQAVLFSTVTWLPLYRYVPLAKVRDVDPPGGC
jgi:hypothetical protein